MHRIRIILCTYVYNIILLYIMYDLHDGRDRCYGILLPCVRHVYDFNFRLLLQSIIEPRPITFNRY